MNYLILGSKFHIYSWNRYFPLGAEIHEQQYSSRLFKAVLPRRGVNYIQKFENGFTKFREGAEAQQKLEQDIQMDAFQSNLQNNYILQYFCPKKAKPKRFVSSTWPSRFDESIIPKQNLLLTEYNIFIINYNKTQEFDWCYQIYAFLWRGEWYSNMQKVRSW